ncbi:hypothetical protein DRJ22_03085 [Candidatus Woesearchaeota archaeon]|nr:MAG: hypothetical protein B6U93_00085 [Candidatus Woesearchaeota archaeon ex4484_78]RLE45994.1 MAG: hypothetical protein DRJ22_03085 [Candidatus Woesearchaeota archaeon]
MVVIKRIGVLSAAKINGIIMLVLGLVIGVFYGVLMMFAGLFSGSKTTFFIGLVLLFLAPFLYGLMGFLGGAAGAFIYNVAVKHVGGIELEIKKR